MKFKKYQHIEKYGSDETDGILDGTVHVFPKIDGTNCCVYLDDDGRLSFGGRRGQVLVSQDNYKFIKYFEDNPTIKENLIKMLNGLPKNSIIYGEWLIPVTLKTYNKDAWRHFYIFDVVCYPDDITDEDFKEDFKSRRLENYLHYDVYSKLCETYGLKYIPCIKTITNPKIEEIETELENSTFLIDEGKGLGEGVIIKNYAYKNMYGRRTWAKLITADFRNKKIKVRTEYHEDKQELLWEHKFVVRYCGPEFVSKEVFKFKELHPDCFENNKFIMKKFAFLSNYIFDELIRDNILIAINEFRDLQINFRALRKLVDKEIKDFVL